MMSVKRRQYCLALGLFCAALLAGNTILEWVVDHDEGHFWTANTLRNWKEFGFFQLNGKLVTNPGGHGLPESPTIYPGHSAVSLYPVYALGFWAPGSNVTLFPFFFLLAITTLLGGAYILGLSNWAFLIGGMTILTPGYVLWPKFLDPNTNSALLGIPYAAFVWWRVSRTKFDWKDFLGLAIVTCIYTRLNWTTALVHGPIFFFLIARKVSLRRLALYTALGAISALVVAALGVISKISTTPDGANKSHGDLAAFLRNYMWGETGYSFGTSTGALLIRFAFINALALAPLWLALGIMWVKCARVNFWQAMLFLSPTLVAYAATMALRNYFCHHPWMGAPVLLVGILLSLSAMAAGRSEENLWPQGVSFSRPMPWIVIAAIFGFSLVELLLYRANNEGSYALRTFIRAQTERSDVILVSEKFDPLLAQEQARLTEGLDRWIELTSSTTNSSKGHRFLLTSEKTIEGWQLVSRLTTGAANEDGAMAAMLNWFKEKISRRKAGDKIQFNGTYSLLREAEAK